MDFNECIRKRLVKDVKKDKNQIFSIRGVAGMKLKSANVLPKEHFISKITLLYDTLRENLECVALEKGYKIYNHECYTSFIREILSKSREAEKFDKIRKIRNGINYYGQKVDEEEAEYIINEIKI
ncbi:MAG: hypothetical protein ACOCQG_02075 [Candidatus Nanoarchaeia archaeon]